MFICSTLPRYTIYQKLNLVHTFPLFAQYILYHWAAQPYFVISCFSCCRRLGASSPWITFTKRSSIYPYSPLALFLPLNSWPFHYYYQVSFKQFFQTTITQVSHKPRCHQRMTSHHADGCIETFHQNAVSKMEANSPRVFSNAGRTWMRGGVRSLDEDVRGWVFIWAWSLSHNIKSFLILSES